MYENSSTLYNTTVDFGYASSCLQVQVVYLVLMVLVVLGVRLSVCWFGGHDVIENGKFAEKTFRALTILPEVEIFVYS